MDNILSKLESLSELSEDELKSLKESVFSEYKSVKPADETAYTVEVVDTLNQLADAKDAINAELANRVQLAAELAAAAEAATSRLDEAEEDTESAEAVEESETEEPEASDKDAEEPAEAEEEDEKEEDDEKKPVGEFANGDITAADSKGVNQGPVEATEAPETTPVTTSPTGNMPTEDVTPENKEAAEATHEGELPEHPTSSVKAQHAFANTPESSEEPVSNLNEFSAPEENAPVVPAKAVKTITAGADLGAGMAQGSKLTSLRQVAQGLLTKRHGMNRASGGEGEQHIVATIETEYSADRVLTRTDAEGNKAKIDAVVSPEAIVAAGGLTAPVETSYDIYELGETDARPVRDALPKFNAERGGIRFLTSPTMSDLEGAVSVWTLQDDIDAASPDAPNPVKPCLRVKAGEEVEVFVEAIPLCLTFGNLQSRAYPELVERHIKLGMVWHARFAEIRLLTRIGQLSTNVTADSELGAARDIFNQIEAAAAAYRNRYRIASDTTLRVMFPEWFRNALRADLIKQLPGDGRDGTFNLGEAEINSWFSARNIAVTWFIDGEAGQIMGEQETGALNGFPTDLVWYMFTEGTFLFLDAGTLDLGLVRDSTLNGTNDYKIFLETFEGVAKVGIESLRITSELRLLGASSGTVDLAGAAAGAGA